MSVAVVRCERGAATAGLERVSFRSTPSTNKSGRGKELPVAVFSLRGEKGAA